MTSKLGDEEIAMYMEMFKLGFKLPIQPYFAWMLVMIGLSPSLLNLNCWRILGDVHVVWANKHKIKPSPKEFTQEFTHLCLCNEHGVGHKGWLSKSTGRRVVLEIVYGRRTKKGLV